MLEKLLKGNRATLFLNSKNQCWEAHTNNRGVVILGQLQAAGKNADKAIARVVKAMEIMAKCYYLKAS